jgi:16S rRNA (adenine(1408)-N(1))-methyltransferase
VSIDLGTGDGRLPYALARADPGRLFVGIDANADGLREVSGRAARARLGNLLYVRAPVEDLPPELAGVADCLTVVLPWGSLLAAVARPVVSVLRGIRGLCRPGARLSVLLSVSARDRSEAARLGLPALDEAHLRGALAAGYEAAGFAVGAVRLLDREALAGWPSTWARRLAQGRPRPVFRIDARAEATPTSSDARS